MHDLFFSCISGYSSAKIIELGQYSTESQSNRDSPFLCTTAKVLYFLIFTKGVHTFKMIRVILLWLCASFIITWIQNL